MTRPCIFGLGVLLGAIATPLGGLVAARISHKHFLSIDLDFKERT